MALALPDVELGKCRISADDLLHERQQLGDLYVRGKYRDVILVGR